MQPYQLLRCACVYEHTYIQPYRAVKICGEGLKCNPDMSCSCADPEDLPLMRDGETIGCFNKNSNKVYYNDSTAMACPEG